MKHEHSGFTMIEAMVALLLVTLLVSFAVPSYDPLIVRSNRGEGIRSLLNAAACQERLFIRNNAFDAAACGGESGNGHYLLSVAVSNAGQGFVISATPQGAQTRDVCGVLTLDDRGVKTANAEIGDLARQCWAGKWGNAPSWKDPT